MAQTHRMPRWGAFAVVALAAATVTPSVVVAEASLRGSRAGMIQQNNVAQNQGLKFHRTVTEIRASVEAGDLVELNGNADYEVADFVSHPYLVPAAHLFVERLARQYRAACGQQLVVTSATRPTGRQPRNAHALSVHPAGMAVDLRVSDRASCRSWLESTLLSLERQGVINGIREFRPPHYHVAVFPEPYLAWLERQRARELAREQVFAGTLSLPAPQALLAGPTETRQGGLMGSAAQEGISVLGRVATALVLTPLIMLLFWGIPRIR